MTTPSGRVDYDGQISRQYVAGRALNTAQEKAWREAFTRHLPKTRPLSGVEVGSGTGRFTPLLAEWFGGPVVGVEPFREMREQAQQASHHAVSYVEGSAEKLPLADQSVDFALMFLVWHHVQNREKAASELYRVLRPGGLFLLRAKFADHMPVHWWLDAFPGGLETDTAGFQPLEEVQATLRGAGFQEVAFETVLQPASGTHREVLERLKLRTLSVFERMTEAQLFAGFAALEEKVSMNPDAPAPDNPATLLVLKRP